MRGHPNPKIRQKIARAGGKARLGTRDPALLADIRGDVLEDHVARVLSQVPPIPADTLSRIADRLRADAEKQKAS